MAEQQIIYLIDQLIIDRPRILYGLAERKKKTWHITDPDSRASLRYRTSIRDNDLVYTSFADALSKLEDMQSSIIDKTSRKLDLFKALLEVTKRFVNTGEPDDYFKAEREARNG